MLERNSSRPTPGFLRILGNSMRLDSRVVRPADDQQPGPVFAAGDDTVAAQLAVEDLAFSFEKPDADIAAGCDGFDEEVPDDVEPTRHGG
jgi:hypothetical protein